MNKETQENNQLLNEAEICNKFEEENLSLIGKKFKDASIFYNSVAEINPTYLKRWLEKSEKIQWDYKNIVKRKGKLERLK